MKWHENEYVILAMGAIALVAFVSFSLLCVL